MRLLTRFALLALLVTGSLGCEKIDDLLGNKPSEPAPAPAAAPAAAPAVAPAPAAAPAPVEPPARTKEQFVVAFAELECALAVLEDPANREKKRVEVLTKHAYSGESYLADMEKFGTIEAESRKAACMPRKGKSADEFAKVFAELTCAAARADATQIEALTTGILAKAGYTAESFAADQEEYGLDQAEKLATACMPVAKGATKEGLLALAIKLECATRTNLPKEEQEEYSAILLDEYGLDEATYAAARAQVKDDAEFTKALADGLKGCPAQEKKKPVEASPLVGRWNGTLGGQTKGHVSFRVVGRGVASADATLNGKRLVVVRKRLRGNNIYLESRVGADWIRLNGTFKGASVNGSWTGRSGGQPVKGTWHGSK
jgi:hypothetical protein